MVRRGAHQQDSDFLLMFPIWSPRVYTYRQMSGFPPMSEGWRISANTGGQKTLSLRNVLVDLVRFELTTSSMLFNKYQSLTDILAQNKGLSGGLFGLHWTPRAPFRAVWTPRRLQGGGSGAAGYSRRLHTLAHSKMRVLTVWGLADERYSITHFPKQNQSTALRARVRELSLVRVSVDVITVMDRRTMKEASRSPLLLFECKFVLPVKEKPLLSGR
jgi:hypothetical protein